MRLIKIFVTREDKTEELEDKVNAWVEATGAEIVSVTGNVAPQSQISYPGKMPAPSDVLMVIVYEPATQPSVSSQEPEMAV